MPISLSAVMITHNADRRLDQALASLQFCDEIIIIDSKSTDRTLEIAQKHSAKILQREFDSFSGQKQFSVDQAKNDWVLVVDSDEVVSEELRDEIISTFSKERAHAGYEIPRVLYFLGKQIQHSGGIDFPLRLFDRRRGKFDGSLVHEKIVVEGKVGRFQNFLEHYSYDSLKDYFQKFGRYTTLAANEAHARKNAVGLGQKMSCFLYYSLKVIVSFPATFIKLYFFKLGFLDGAAGFLWCFFSAMSPVVKYAKLTQRTCRN